MPDNLWRKFSFGRDVHVWFYKNWFEVSRSWNSLQLSLLSLLFTFCNTGNLVMITRCWYVTLVIKDITRFAYNQLWLQYQRMAGSVKWVNLRQYNYLLHFKYFFVHLYVCLIISYGNMKIVEERQYAVITKPSFHGFIASRLQLGLGLLLMTEFQVGYLP